ncbi:hypothetical protein CLV98_10950 [Dyadobacter jejuensis]|uniref:DUF6089 domain-containing protein n=1 Tax=Dyadobacter jejuensis TaxID=1082580 RepID=A0A316AH27_9BACT|nr:DUF6089 family protein [Dyadobacter jejuensis]PWJ56941.1 hypothetical protein CLV98_10950 [Dyadobacter jejuensis]
MMFRNSLRAGSKIQLAGLTILSVLGLSANTHAQYKAVFIPYSTIGFGIGTSSYYGDLATYRRPVASTFNQMRWSVGANYTRHFTPRLAARASFTWARIAGDDFKMNNSPKYQTNILFARNFQFRNDLKEFSLQGIFKLTPDDRTYERRSKIGTYVVAGLALAAHNPKALYLAPTSGDKYWVKLQPLGTEGQGNAGYAKPYSLVQLSIPVGFGVRYKINSRFDISAELGYRFTFTDYLDDVAGNYAAPSLLQDPVAQQLANRSAELVSIKKGQDRLPGLTNFVQTNYNVTTTDPVAEMQARGFGAPGSQRGNNPSLNDAYMTGMIHLHYIIPSQIKCPPLK